VEAGRVHWGGRGGAGPPPRGRGAGRGWGRPTRWRLKQRHW